MDCKCKHQISEDLEARKRETPEDTCYTKRVHNRIRVDPVMTSQRTAKAAYKQMLV